MKLLPALKAQYLLPLLPVLLVWLWALLWPQMQTQLQNGSTAPALTALQTLSAFVAYLPLLLAQALLAGLLWPVQTRPSRLLLWLGWGAGMLLYPWLSLQYQDSTVLTFNHWLAATMLSLLYWLHLAYQRRQHSDTVRWRWLWSLDTVLVLLLAVWTVGWTLLLVSHPPGFAQQPIPVQLNWTRLGAEPLLFLWYLWQFAVLAAAMFGCYWLTRYYLIRKVLALHGLLPFLLLSLGLILLSYAPLAWLLLQLPMNQGVAVPAVPGGSQDPFDWYNFNFMLLQWLMTTPLILAFERQQQDSTLAQVRHLQVRTELQLLQQQINPHFLFNTLNNLYALCLIKSDAAPQLVLKLADLLRYVVYQGQQSQVTLQQELDYLQHYVELQQLRVSNKTSVSIDFPADASGVQLPPLLLIMLLENAYKHGVESSAAASQIWLSATVTPQRLVFICRNTLPEQAAGAAEAGMGLENLRRRLQLLYGDDFVLHSGPDAQLPQLWHAELQLPLWTARGLR